ncbi:MAG: acylphosphatase [Bdellovibrio sp. CG12_big_fil_rev_8_21_14_0_65_39_13]|nr:MAG: acylphosphatase [Bdellovibrio sp. CG22_combo_CG10-13_8_21_14_all_39_27]PIQ59460.1 MAG: acylphosphatase [Bdellovibrio sp. CG12_big_fil_rev_8_21_14_0_65_39_13]PIR36590.1 MAG: acylphosphatase [Bdellovibrio sp. CG11_big_fil_rev_8_21_14_0_20_39_38]
MPGKHLKIKGRVQGVWYRKSFSDEALKNRLVGWVKNCDDGTVEAIIQGDDQAIKSQIEWARKGPPLAKVELLEVQDDESGMEFAHFEIKR